MHGEHPICADFHTDRIVIRVEKCTNRRMDQKPQMLDEIRDPPQIEDLKRRARLIWLAFILAVVASSLVVALLAQRYGRDVAVSDLLVQGRTETSLKSALLRAVLERPRALPLILSQDRDVSDALMSGGPGDVERLNRKLESLVVGTKASVIYVINSQGVTIASSNWREKTSFVGSDYSFRDYFRAAMATGAGEQFALGNVSNKPGLYISTRVGFAEAKLGVVVVKMEFDQLEADWRESGRPAFITGRENVVLITNIPSWRFMTTRALPPNAAASIRDSLQFGNAPLQPLPLRALTPLAEGVAQVAAILRGTGEASFIELEMGVPTTSWTLHYLVPVEPTLANSVWHSLLASFAAFLGASVLMADRKSVV